MIPLSGFGMRNFRVFEEEAFFELSPITVLTGTNSSGKSTLLKGLLLAQESLIGTDLSRIRFSGGNHQLGNFSKTLPFTSEEKSFTLSFALNCFDDMHMAYRYRPSVHSWLGTKYIIVECTYESINGQTGRLKQCRLFDDKKKQIAWVRFPEGLSEFDYGINWGINLLWFFAVLKEKQKKKANLDKEQEKLFTALNVKTDREASNENAPQSLRNSFFDVGLLNKEKLIESTDYQWSVEELAILQDYLLQHLAQGGIPDSLLFFPDTNYETPLEAFQRGLKDVGEIIKGKNKSKGKSFFMHPMDMILSFPDEEENPLLVSLLKKIESVPLGKIINKETESFFSDIVAEIELIFSAFNKFRIHHVEGVRSRPRRLYTDIRESLPFERRLIHYLGIEPTKSQEAFIQKWLMAFGLGESVRLESVEDVAVKIVLTKDGNDQVLGDLGYGVSQLLPIILQLAYEFNPTENMDPEAPPWEILLIEEPEANLHPALQAKLADLFLDAIQTLRVQLIIETHSEYLIRALQNRVADQSIAANDIALYYIHNQEQKRDTGKAFERLHIQENGAIDYQKFGAGFYDESEKLEQSRLNISFAREFNLLKEKAANEEKLQEELDRFLLNRNFTLYEDRLTAEFGKNRVRKLDIQALRYLASAHYLLANLSGDVDYAPVALQIGRFWEHQLSVWLNLLKEDPVTDNVDMPAIPDEEENLQKQYHSLFKWNYKSPKKFRHSFSNYQLVFEALLDDRYSENSLIRHYRRRCKDLVVRDRSGVQKLFSSVPEIRSIRNLAAHSGNPPIKRGEVVPLLEKTSSLLNSFI